VVHVCLELILNGEGWFEPGGHCFIELHQYQKTKSGFSIYDLISNSTNLMDIALIRINVHQ
jgi:hypothetical protein